MTWLSQLLGFFKAFQIWIVVAPWELGLRVRFGKSATTLGPGPHWRIPFIDRVFIQSARLRTITDSGQTIATKDGKVLTLAVAVSYAIIDIEKLYSAVSNPEQTLLSQIQGMVAALVATTESNTITPAVVEDAVTRQMPSAEWGLGQVRLMVTNFAFVKTFRLLNYEYRNLSTADDLEPQRL